ncbi:MAG TPA: serine hydrolase [Steroidobacteraceae bacterium]
MKRNLGRLTELDRLIEPMLNAARIPGAAIAIIMGGDIVFSRGYGYRDLASRLPANSKTIYPIASTTKAINATLLGMLVDDGRLQWDAPVQDYLPRFRLIDPIASSHVTIRDLITMRTGLPRHDWMWMAHPISRAELVERLRYLEVSAGLRERFQYTNLTVIASGHIAEVVAGQTWEDLVRERLFKPLGMTATGFELPVAGDVTSSYHENPQHELVLTRRFATGDSGPSGGSIHSNVEDMARWMAFNLSDGSAGGTSLIQAHTLRDIHSPCVVVGAVPESISPNCAYGCGWFLDTYNGQGRVSHSGYLFDVNSDIALFPQEGIGIVSFTNFGFPRFSRFINEHAFDLIMGLNPVQTLETKLVQNENRRKRDRECSPTARRAKGTLPSHRAEDYAGSYEHPAYGAIRIHVHDSELVLQRDQLSLPLEHWHYDVWFVRESDVMTTHEPYLFDQANRLMFESDADGEISAVLIRLEPVVAPVRFRKSRACAG